MLLEMLDRFELISPGCVSSVPSLQAFESRITSLPAVKTYRDSEAFQKRKTRFFGRMAPIGAGEESYWRLDWKGQPAVLGLCPAVKMSCLLRRCLDLLCRDLQLTCLKPLISHLAKYYILYVTSVNQRPTIDPINVKTVSSLTYTITARPSLYESKVSRIDLPSKLHFSRCSFSNL